MDTYKLFLLNFVFKQKNHSIPDAFNNYFVPRSAIHNSDTRGAIELHIPKAKNNFGLSSIKVVGAKTFNKLPRDISTVKTEKGFKRAVKLQLLANY